jgi:hypothetical protein
MIELFILPVTGAATGDLGEAPFLGSLSSSSSSSSSLSPFDLPFLPFPPFDSLFLSVGGSLSPTVGGSFAIYYGS